MFLLLYIKLHLIEAVSEGDTSSAELYVGGDVEILRNNYEWIPKLLAKDDYVFDSTKYQ